MRKFYKIITRKINTLTNLFNDYKKRNNDLISFYKLLIDNYEQIRNLKNYIFNKIFSKKEFIIALKQIKMNFLRLNLMKNIA